ncbi:type IV toxin-antitoxin system AbiEi family antitoxin domain-containing protein [Nannocystis bainbridge]|uniref:Type IV toxin-antitoxin system AbiEi family antitoxin domain-containing protein n=1 Tax=Nannocystis bainbridge TaxID=2995303 RepID=A0ABT5E9J8_9BACT|nr:type IV toxin-antitoxin system AbiEi family antitoxin domain-containing protein [Nannocystis bainbridge]MDC0721593.1 type IV toxin-antitoxin system AbiEi family antitoxin domain-containing protein [Nannocystis bainbridge]
MRRREEGGPDWDRLFEIAAAQDGYFSVDQAQSAGISRPNLQAHLHRGHVRRPRRAVYRLVRYPVGEHEELAEIWLQSDREGVFSHETALALHRLSDVLPANIHITLPIRWRRRRGPDGVVVAYDEVPPEERQWFGAVPVTSVVRTLRDCAAGAVSPELLKQAAMQALRRGLVDREAIGEVERALLPYGGLDP